MELKKKWLSIVILLFSVSLIGYFLYKNQQVFVNLKNLNPLALLLIATTMVAGLYVNGLSFKILTRPFNIEVKEHFLLSISTSFFNLISFFSGGMGVRAVYMKKKYDLKYSDFLASLFGNYVVILMVDAVIGLLTFLIVYIKFGILNLSVILVFITIFFTTLFCMLIRNFRFKSSNFFARNINKIINGWQIIIKHKWMVSRLAILVVVNLLLAALANYIAFWGVGLGLDFFKVLYLSVITTLSIFTLNLTPGQIGIMEGLYMISGKILGIPYEQSLLVSLIVRAVYIIILAIFGPISNMILLKKLTLADTGHDVTIEQKDK